jgi:hypothetical protein
MCDHRENEMRTILVAVVMALAGCVSPLAFDRGAATEEQFTKDTAECEYDAEKSRAGMPVSGDPWMDIAAYEGAFRKVYRSCMRVRGYAEAK